MQGGGDECFTGNFLISGRWESWDRSETVSGPTLEDVLEVFTAGLMCCCLSVHAVLQWKNVASLNISIMKDFNSIINQMK